MLKELWGRNADDAPPVYGRKLTMAMARSRLDEHKLRDVELEELKEQLAAMQSQLAKLVKEG